MKLRKKKLCRNSFSASSYVTSRHHCSIFRVNPCCSCSFIFYTPVCQRTCFNLHTSLKTLRSLFLPPSENQFCLMGGTSVVLDVFRGGIVGDLASPSGCFCIQKRCFSFCTELSACCGVLAKVTDELYLIFYF